VSGSHYQLIHAIFELTEFGHDVPMILRLLFLQNDNFIFARDFWWKRADLFFDLVEPPAADIDDGFLPFEFKPIQKKLSDAAGNNGNGRRKENHNQFALEGSDGHYATNLP
jgi:hypothetical protein